MAEAKELPSGSWRALVYTHSEQVYDDAGRPVRYKNGRLKKKKNIRILHKYSPR